MTSMASSSLPHPEASLLVQPDESIGIVGSPSSTGEVTIDIRDNATGETLLGDLVYLSHPLSAGRHLLALGTVSAIETRNRWHEDLNMRGVLKVHGTLPHLSAVGDTRTATVVVQAVYDTDRSRPPFIECPRESGGALGMSPTTGSPVHRVGNEVVQALIQRHIDSIVYLGHVYRTSVQLPMFVHDYSGTETDGAFHTGIFGRSGSGKTAFAVYLLAAQLRHANLGLLVFDPQGQFASQNGFPFDFHAWARRLGRDVQVLSLAEDIRLPVNARLCLDLLESTNFFRQLTVNKSDNREAARDEMIRLLQGVDDWANGNPEDVLRSLFVGLLNDAGALQRVFNSSGPRARLVATLNRFLSDPDELEALVRVFARVHNLFAPQNLNGAQRRDLWPLLQRVLDAQVTPKPIIIIDLTARGSEWLDSTETQARLIHTIASRLRLVAESVWRQSGAPINCGVVFDEAHRFAASNPEGDRAAALSTSLVDYVRTTRKYGLGWTFITQEIGSLAPAIYSQLRVRAFGYGLTSGSDLVRLTDEVGRGAALDLYKSFADPRALTEKVYPFMITGPVSPLSFTTAPVFLQVFTNISTFVEANRSNFTTLGP